MHTGRQEIGPYGVGWKRRKHTWVRAANLLFIDNPVGTGWSYVDKHGEFGEGPINHEIPAVIAATTCGLGEGKALPAARLEALQMRLWTRRMSYVREDVTLLAQSYVELC